ncbi:hypothetical protein [Marinobacter halophilus]|uniref:Polysaccharide biosynthesis protein C-terminal domain-containing protein n=1 Tax=Marinobacter halophilus TaxID=1323740 RepID=A0A2T1KCA5_9GAMM|nr:hypothetical protein [Marinobacter halophilus]PSF07764.1 hypothetical protein C7H08_10135 [Marinobacter halophilus]
MTNRLLVAYSLVGIIYNVFLMVSSIVFVRAFNPEAIGEYFYLVFLSSAICNIALFGNATYINKHLQLGTGANLQSRLVVFSFLSIAIYLIILTKSDQSFSGLYVFMILFEAGLLKVVKDRIFTSYLRSLNRLSAYSFFLIGSSVLRLSVTFVIFKYEIKIEHAIILYFIITLFFSLIAFAALINLKEGFGDVSISNYCRDGSPYFIATVFTMLYDYVPVLFLKYFNGSSVEIAYYVSSYKIISIFILGLAIVSPVFLQYQRKIYLKEKHGKNVMSGAIFLILALSILYLPIFLFLQFNSSFVIGLIFGSEYDGAESTLRAISYCIWGSSINFIAFATFQALDLQKLVPKIVGPFALANLVATYYAAPMGSSSVAVVFAVSILGSAAISFYILLKRNICERRAFLDRGAIL